MTNAFPLSVPALLRPRACGQRLGSELPYARRSPISQKLGDSVGHAEDQAEGQADSLFYALARSVEERDPSLGRHCEHLALMSSVMGFMLGLPVQDISALNHAGYLHDIGKRDLPDSILLKRDPLTDVEWKLMRNHPVRGEEICKGVPALESVLPIIRHHHERWDGSGYPDGLKGEDIPLLARILQMADIYDALTSERPYKEAFSAKQALVIIQREADRGWRDPKLLPLVKAASPMFHSEPFWALSSLSLTALDAALRGYGLPRITRQS